MAAGADSGRGTSAGTSTRASRPSRSTGPSARIRSRSSRTPSSPTPSARSTSTADVRAVVLTGAGGNFCSGGDVHEIIGPLVAMREQGDARGPAALHPHDRRSGEGDARLPAADRRRGRRHLRRRRRHPRDGQRPAPRHARAARSASCSCASACRAPTWARARSCRASSARAAPASCSTPGRFMDGAEAERWGFYNRLVDAGRAARRGARRWRAALADGPTFAHADDQALPARRVGHGRRRGDRGRGRGAGRAACRPRTSRAPTARSSRSSRPCSKATDVADATYLAWPFFDDAHRALQRDARGVARSRAAARTTTRIPAAACRAYVAQLGAAGWLRYAVPRAYGGALDALDVRSLCLIRETLGYASGLAEFAFAMQGLGSGPISLFGSDALKRQYLPGVAAGKAHRGVRDLGGRRRLRRRGDADHRPPRRRRRSSSTARRPGSRTPASPAHYVVFCRWPEGGERSFVAARRRRRHARPRRSARTIDVMAPHPLGTLTFSDCRVPADQRRRRAGQGHARRARARSTSSARRSAPRRSASPGARFDEAVAHVRERRRVRQAARGVPADAGAHRRHGDGHRRGGAARLSRGVDARPGRRRASRAKRRWPSSSPPSRRSR